MFAQACLEDALRSVGVGRWHGGRQEQRFSHVHLLVDAGPHFVCGRFIGWAMRHLRCSVPGLEEGTLAPAAPGHGKGPIERKRWVSDLPTYVARLQEACDNLFEGCNARPHRAIFSFAPPRRDS